MNLDMLAIGIIVVCSTAFSVFMLWALYHWWKEDKQALIIILGTISAFFAFGWAMIRMFP